MATTSKKQPFGGKQAPPFGKKGDKSKEEDAKKKPPAKKSR